MPLKQTSIKFGIYGDFIQISSLNKKLNGYLFNRLRQLISYEATRVKLTKKKDFAKWHIYLEGLLNYNAADVTPK